MGDNRNEIKEEGMKMKMSIYVPIYLFMYAFTSNIIFGVFNGTLK